MTKTSFTAEDVGKAAGIMCEERTRLVRGLETFHGARRLLTIKYEDVSEHLEQNLRFESALPSIS